MVRDVDWDVYNPMDQAVPPRQPQDDPNRYERLPDGTLWIRAGSFSPDAAQARALDAMLERLAAERDVRRVVFDLRGNGGGDSRLGHRIFEAATGGLDMDTTHMDALPRLQADWRVSDVAVATFEEHIARFTARDGADSAAARHAREMRDAMRSAQARGERWLIAWDGERHVDAAEATRRHAHLRKAVGRLAVLTDDGCASACLDMVDEVRRVPGALQVGETTSADAVYIDIGFVEMPSGNRLILPLKVWRNRVRGNNEAWVPDVALDLRRMAEAEIRAAALAAIDRGR